MINYFEFYNLPLSFDPDQEAIRSKFYALSKQFHPDFFVNESPEKQAEVLEQSTQNNKAFQVLSDPQKRLKYILELKGLLTEGENYALPQAFLMEMMEVNEGLMDLQFEPDAEKLEKLKSEVNQMEISISQELKSLGASFEQASEEEQSAILLAIKDLYYRNQYLLRIKEGIKKINQ